MLEMNEIRTFVLFKSEQLNQLSGFNVRINARSIPLNMLINVRKMKKDSKNGEIK